ncbi:uncharacterized protein LOC131875151 [Cryptomeria japonica]|uniref:uncharacterized protein LOC131875151 n=1 Tax=Cryptomeria japonica TaxID=3369 RepID=UPI0027DA17D3|nr:uncharacterized protein LOC131875151 [Cryptomeria japonica]
MGEPEGNIPVAQDAGKEKEQPGESPNQVTTLATMDSSEYQMPLAKISSNISRWLGASISKKCNIVPISIPTEDTIKDDQVALAVHPNKRVKLTILVDDIPAKDVDDHTAGLWTMEFDGSCASTKSGAGVVLISPHEYEALFLGIEQAKKKGIKLLCAKGDAKLIVNQVCNHYSVKNERLKHYRNRIWDEIEYFDAFSIEVIPRSQNSHADSLAVSASLLLPHPNFGTDVYRIEVVYRPNIPDNSNFCILLQKNELGKEFPIEFMSIPLKKHELNYSLNEKQAFTVVKAVKHFRYYILHSHSIVFVPNSAVKRKPQLAALPLRPVVVEEPFKQWGLDFIAPLTPSSSAGHTHILTTTDYFTKWVEAVPVRRTTSKVICEFLKENSLVRFGVPLKIVTDNAASFSSTKISMFYYDHGISLAHSSDYYP